MNVFDHGGDDQATHLALMRTLWGWWWVMPTSKQVSLYLSFSQDESYTPCQLAVRAGTTFNDLRVRNIMLILSSLMND